MSLSVELSGLNAAQTDLDTIGNNVANVGTTGFKSSTPYFASLYGTSLLGAGGTKLTPGQGAVTTNLAQLFTEGSISQTGNPLDVAITGNGFLQLQTTSGIAFSRDGSLQLNAQGFLANDTGALVMGFNAPVSGASPSGTLAPIQVSQSNIPPVATSNLAYNINLSTSDPVINTTATPFSVSNTASYSESTTTSVFDSLGASRSLTTFFTQVSGSGSPPAWATHFELTSSGGAVVASGAGPTLTFNNSGGLSSGNGTISVSGLPNGAAPLSITQDFTGSSLSGLPFGVNSLVNNGNGGGQFSGLAIANNGNVVASYSNGATKIMGVIGLANFANPQGLVPTSNNNWLASQESGQPVTNPPGTGGLGQLESGAIEGSNVDLSAQLVNLIIAQQAYQANVQGINVDQQDVQRLLQLQ
jgi:flagellar hook protein FlgE